MKAYRQLQSEYKADLVIEVCRENYGTIHDIEPSGKPRHGERLSKSSSIIRHFPIDWVTPSYIKLTKQSV